MRLLLVAMLGCSGSSESTATEPAISRERSIKDIGCTEFFDHINQLTDTPTSGPPTKSNLEYCRKFTAEQRWCAMSATTIPELNLCTGFADIPRRELGRRVQTAIKASWPGTVDLHAILVKQQGCAFVGVVGMQGYVLDETHAVVSFATHETPITNATFTREGNVWQCTEAEAPNTCESLARLCKKS
jgi:hypothetical protein